MEEKLKTLFDYQCFESSPRLAKLIRQAESRSMRELSDDEAEMAAGGAAQPQAPNPVDTVGAVMPLDVKLDPFQAGKDAYMPTSVEAIFARELYPADNMGDINADGIPDLYVKFYKLDGEGTQPTTTDLKPITRYYNGNTDGDYLPSTLTGAYASLPA